MLDEDGELEKPFHTFYGACEDWPCQHVGMLTAAFPVTLAVVSVSSCRRLKKMLNLRTVKPKEDKYTWKKNHVDPWN